ncbi:MAG: ATP phosphoribosyltransferase regulatory subunit [Thermoanaerobacteraceae bacterium]
MIFLPDGVQDFLPDEYAIKHAVEEKIRKTFISFGYKDIMPPTFEYSSNFSVLFDENNLYRFFDKKGNILALRPDVTSQIGRIVSTKLKDKYPIKLCYVANVFRYEDTQSGKMREFTQAGVELIGLNQEESDAEVIALSIEALRTLGLKDFKVEIGQAQIFNGIIENINLGKEETIQLREFLEQKNQSAIETFIKEKKIKDDKARLLIELPLLFGDENIILKVKKLYNIPKLNDSLDYLLKVYKILKDFGLSKYISFDLGMVQNLNYYTGIIFRCFIKGIGYAIYTGGRYDNLLSVYGKNIPATGFAISIERVMLALKKQNIEILNKVPKVLIKYEEKARDNAYSKALDLRVHGKIVEIYSINRSFNIFEDDFDEIIYLEE